MATAKKPIKKPSTAKAKTKVRSLSTPRKASVANQTPQYGTKVRLGVVVLLLLSIAFLLMVLTNYT